MSEMKLEVINTSYAIRNIGIDNLQVLSDREYDWNETLSEKMERELDVFAVEYNGHFSDSIYYRVDSDYDNPKLHENVMVMIIAALKLAKADQKAIDEAPECQNCGKLNVWHTCCKKYHCDCVEDFECEHTH